MKDWLLSGSIVAAVVAAVGALLWLGKLQGTVETIRSGVFVDQDKKQIEMELRVVRDSLAALSRGLSDLRREIHEAPGEDHASVEVAFTAPPDDQLISREIGARGTSAGLQKNQEVWLVVFEHEDRKYHLFPHPVDRQANGNWSAFLEIGDHYDQGRGFDLVAVVPDSAASRELIVETGPWEELGYPWGSRLSRLPPGVTEYARVTVRRE